MARDDDDIEALLADVERTLGRGGPAPERQPARRSDPAPAPRSSSRLDGVRAGVAARFRAALVAAVVAGAAVFALFAVTPFLGAVSGGAGAAVAAFVAVGVTYRRR
ncbi:hypothetical protein EV189_1041 [Motilibacter rhizosphaerae]|uniref:DUF3040 family protein n=1 Tax=Motilibacter rhizosphaerae TaxID=598652 RepID=A0A4Q7NWT4_9ACTN|nr:hypothetical protein [Motilibacter rhizosphaerae]RZS91791.1 hypothetical protein EV189_1041 [Motilibacter rhizosphaerae]